MKPAQSARLNKARVVMDAVRERIGRPYEEIATLGSYESDQLFNQAYSDMLGKFRNYEHMKYVNAYSRVLSLRKEARSNK